MRNGLKNVLVNTALVLGSSALTFLMLFAAGELVMRFRYGSVAPGPPQGWARPDETRGWVMVPGRYSYFAVGAARRVEVFINELGLRQGHLTPAPAAGVQRITILGDSFVFGSPVDDAETIPSQLQAFAGPEYEIVNVSAPGYGTGQQFRQLEELRARGYDPGAKVVLAFFTNDIHDNLALDYGTLAPVPTRPAFRVDASGNLQQTRARVEPPPAQPSETHGSLFWPYLRYQVDVVMMSQPRILEWVDAVGLMPKLPRTPGIASGWYAPGWEARWKALEEVLDYVVRSLRDLPGPPQVYIVFVPSPFQMEGAFRRAAAANADLYPAVGAFLSDPDRPQRLLEGFAGRSDVTFLDLTPAVREAARSSVIYFPREGHFTAAGNELAARILFERVVVDDRVDGPPSPPSSPVYQR